MTLLPGVGLHDTTFDPVGLWQLNGTLVDTSGNGFDMSVDTGAVSYTELAVGLRGLNLDGTNSVIGPAAGTALEIAGDITVECLMVYTETAGPGEVPIMYAESGDTEAANALYGLGTFGALLPLQWFHEAGAGVDQIHLITDVFLPRQLYHLAAVRSANQVQFYLNGIAIGAASTTLLAATGGTTARLRFGRFVGNATFEYHGGLASVKIIARALTAAEVLSEYRRTVGAAWRRPSAA